ncbi:MAG: hypothetical protein BGO14_07175 [Chlamydiales bacterium 38-26]|nr:hypothetical protein [Chlamydiales bacterium]OJV10785.1 MAG: hypothetical protein BGO14_07175 [Chlamydiales bacterium 38-26]
MSSINGVSSNQPTQYQSVVPIQDTTHQDLSDLKLQQQMQEQDNQQAQVVIDQRKAEAARRNLSRLQNKI